MIKFIGLLFLFLLSSSVFANQNSEMLGYESAEHVSIGDQVKLKFAANIPAKAGTKLHLANGLTLSYGEIVALAGDFYGIVEAPISLGATDRKRQERFLQAYNTLAKDPAAVSEVPKILEVIYNQAEAVRIGMEKGEHPADIFSRIATDNNIAWNCITGGICRNDDLGITQEVLRQTYFLHQGRYLKLAGTNFDHFNKHAWLAYSAGHAIALNVAKEGFQTQDIKKLETAYSLNAYACHFLSDGFSSGHMRTPRLALYTTVIPSTFGSVLAKFMHDDDDKSGLMVSNQRGDYWQAFGDDYYYDARNQRNREILQEVMQLSADEIFSAYSTGVSQESVFNLVPDFDKLLATRESRINPSPLFYWDNNQKVVMRRNDLNDAYDYHWRADWSSWITLSELADSRGMPHLKMVAQKTQQKNDWIHSKPSTLNPSPL